MNVPLTVERKLTSHPSLFRGCAQSACSKHSQKELENAGKKRSFPAKCAEKFERRQHVTYMKYENPNKTSTSPWNLTLPGPLYNQPSHEMKSESMLIIFCIPSIVKDLKNFTKWTVKLQEIINEWINKCLHCLIQQ